LKELFHGTLITYKECRKLAPKLGFKDSAEVETKEQREGL
jgi:hypothetical protein